MGRQRTMEAKIVVSLVPRIFFHQTLWRGITLKKLPNSSHSHTRCFLSKQNHILSTCPMIHNGFLRNADSSLPDTVYTYIFQEVASWRQQYFGVTGYQTCTLCKEKILESDRIPSNQVIEFQAINTE